MPPRRLLPFQSQLYSCRLLGGMWENIYTSFVNDYQTKKLNCNSVNLQERVIEAGHDKIRIKYCPSKVHIHRDIMAAENMTDILVYEINGLSRPEYLSWQVVNCKKVTEIKVTSPMPKLRIAFTNLKNCFANIPLRWASILWDEPTVSNN